MSPITRRDFVLNTTLATGALALPPILRAQNRTGSERTRALIQPVHFSQVGITDAFWQPKQHKIATVTLAACILQTEVKTGRIRNFEKAARFIQARATNPRAVAEPHAGIFFDDSDVYKALEAIAYSLKTHPNTELERKADEWIDKIAAAQLPDGYLNTYYTLTGLDQRWSDMDKHEDYCAGHLIEAALAYYRTTGKRKFLDVAIRFADYLDGTFRVPDRHWVSGHEEIELALMKLYHLTQNDRYVKLAEWYLDQRGRGYGRCAQWDNGKPDYCQDVVPVKEQREITGHAVRAMYLYTGAADVAAVTGDADYMHAMQAVWEDVVHRNMYVTGGIGSAGENEGFSVDYDLPNASAYCETCASCGMVYWNQRMAQLTGESQYVDVLERSLYNGALDGVSLTGDRFFYVNPLASTAAPTLFGKPGRKDWFGVACCPSNISRLVASLGSYIYGVSDRDLWVNLYISSNTRFKLGESGTLTNLNLESNYPWDGEIKLTLDPAHPVRSKLHLRIPGWALNQAVPGDLYRFTDTQSARIDVLVNRKKATYRLEKGYAVIDRTWNKGDVIEMNLPMTVRRIVARDEVASSRGRIALQRGPLVYCVEGADNPGHVWNFITTHDGVFTERAQQILNERIVALQFQAPAVTPTPDGLGVQPQTQTITAIPYYTWANRDNYDMQVWLPTKIEHIKINA